MILVAAYIIEHYLFDKPQAINFVGNYYYNFELVDKKIILNRSKNDNYVENLHSDKISEVSAIVGANGSGKTTLFSIINQHGDSTRCILVYENTEGTIKIVNRTGQIDENGDSTSRHQIPIFFEDENIEATVNIDIPPLYYSPIPDQDLNKFRSPISKTSHFGSTLAEYHLENIERSTMLMADDLAEEIKSVYPSLPLYNHISLFAKPLFKKDLRNTYGGFKVEGDIEKIQKETLERLWDSYPIKNKDKAQYTNDNKDFFKNIEVNILSYLNIDGTAMETAFNGEYEISYFEILEEDNFEKKLKQLFFHKIAHIDNYIYQSLKEAMVDFDYHMLLFQFETSNFDEILKAKKESTISALQKIKKAIMTLDEDEALSLMEDDFNALLQYNLKGKEFVEIKDILSKFLEFITSKSDLEIKKFRKELHKGLDEVEAGLIKTFDSFFEARHEIIDQLKEGIKKAIRLFNAIQSFYLITKEFSLIDGVQLKEGQIDVNLKKVEFLEFKKLIHSYRRLLEEFNGNSLIKAQILEFRPDKRLSYGEKSLLNLFSSFNEWTINKRHYLRRKKNYLILLDEADLGFHPLWKKKYISAITKILPIIFDKLNNDVDNSKNPELDTRKIQIIISTHDPLTLSDIPNYNIVYIDKIKNDKSDIVHVLENHLKPKHSFGANVHDLLANSFFLKNGFMGEFAEGIIKELITYLNLEINLEGRDVLEELTLEHVWNKESAQKIINIIDEPLIKERLTNLFEKKFIHPNESLVREKIAELNNVLKSFGNEEN